MLSKNILQFMIDLQHRLFFFHDPEEIFLIQDALHLFIHSLLQTGILNGCIGWNGFSLLNHEDMLPLGVIRGPEQSSS
jgi:hypothetical protein